MKNQKTKNWEEELLKNFNDPLDMMKLDIDYLVAYNANKKYDVKRIMVQFRSIMYEFMIDDASLLVSEGKSISW